MTVAYWVLAGLLAVAFLAAGLGKLLQPKEALKARGMAYVEDFTAGQVKLIGLAEVVGAVGVVLPKALDVAPVLSPIAAVCLAALMVGAVATHVRRKEAFAPPAALAVLAGVVAVLGFVAL